jgi:hypothetical protein
MLTLPSRVEREGLGKPGRSSAGGGPGQRVVESARVWLRWALREGTCAVLEDGSETAGPHENGPFMSKMGRTGR